MSKAPMKKLLGEPRNKRVPQTEAEIANREKYQFKPGQAPYGDFLKSLTPEQYAEHMEARRTRRTLRQLMSGNIDDSREYWASAMTLAMGVQLQKAIVNGDTGAFVQLWDRTIGKPADTVNMAVQQDETVEDIVAKLQATTVIESIKEDEDDKED